MNLQVENIIFIVWYSIGDAYMGMYNEKVKWIH